MSPQDAPPVPSCYRHPGIPAGVVCQRCDRPICPQCMNQASVGFQCPECARTGAQKVYRGPAAFGVTRPVVTMGLIAVNVAVFLLGIALSGQQAFTGASDTLMLRGGLIAELFQHGNQYFTGPVPGSTPGGVANGVWYRIITAGFLHYGIIHIAFNMWALWILGRILEQVGGRWKFAAVYATSLVAGSLGAMILSPHSLTAGASGAIYGLMGGMLALQRSRGIPFRESGLIAILLINLVITFGLPGISIGGHIGGLIGGGVAGFLVYDLGDRKDIPKALPWIGCAVVLAACFVGTIVVAQSAARF